MAHIIIAESTSFVEDFSPVSTFHASPEAAFPNLLDLALVFVLFGHGASLLVESLRYRWAIAHLEEQ